MPSLRFKIEWHDVLESTNTHLCDRVRANPELDGGLVVAARTQTAGRGRGGKSWVATTGENLTFSVLLRPQRDHRMLASLPMASALATADLLSDYGVGASLKWPNDVLVNGRKICGVLQEVLANGEVVLGVGLNVNMGHDAASSVEHGATSMRIITDTVFDLEPLLDRYLVHFGSRYAGWLRDGFPALRSSWEALSIDAAITTRGVFAGYGDHGELLVTADDGTVRAIWSD